MRIGWMALAIFTAVASAQTATTPTRGITATGNASVSAKPDQAMVDIGVSTQATTANDASTQNATQVSSVLAAIRFVLGQDANIQTVNYSLSPQYSTGSNQTIIGYVATNTVEATLTDLSLIGKVIDVSIAAGANRVNGIRFGLQNDESVRAQALKLAAAAALNQAKAIASGLGVSTGAVLHASQGTASVFTPSVAGAAATSTPVEPGLIQVQGTVTVEVAIQ